MKKPIPEIAKDLAKEHFQLHEIDGCYFAEVPPGKEYIYKQILSVANFKKQGEKFILLYKL